MKYLVAMAALAALATAAGCQTQSYEPHVSNIQTATRTAAVDDEAVPEGMRCEYIRELGSRMPAKKVCQSEAGWARMRENAQEIVRELERLPIPTT